MFALDEEVADLLAEFHFINNAEIFPKNYPHPDYPDSKLGFARETTISTMILLARDVGCNIIVRTGKNGKWYLKKCEPELLMPKIQKIQNDHPNRVKNCKLFVVQFKPTQE